MKKAFALILLLCVILLAGCSDMKKYTFLSSTDEIISIEIIEITTSEAQNKTSPQYKTLKEIGDIGAFISDFYNIPFDTYMFGELTTVGFGTAVRIEYKDGSLEYIKHDAQLRITSSGTFYGSRNCNKGEFDDLLAKYLQ
ncbi:MAG: hypothetical protein IKD45_05970 [Clostridia bacterium]|nr:hypothetical protein [Clostridia bacterium]